MKPVIAQYVCSPISHSWEPEIGSAHAQLQLLELSNRLCFVVKIYQVLTQSQKSLLAYTAHTLAKIKWYVSGPHFTSFLPLWDGEVGKNIHFDRPRVNQRRYSQLLEKKFAQTLHPAHKKTWRSDFNKEFGITIYGPMIYTAPSIRILMRADG